MNVREIRLDSITIPVDLHRKTIDAARLERLAASIAAVGLLNPITVEPHGDHFILRAGHRRLEAHRLLRRATIAANVRDAAEIAHGEVLTWTENLEREDISPIEEAEACARMQQRTHYSVPKIAALLRRSPDWVKERLALLDIPQNMQDLVHTRELPMSHALELARVTDDAHREHLTRYALLSGASYIVLRDWVAQWRLHAEHPQNGAAPLPPLPGPGERVIVLLPCLTCGAAYPPQDLRAAHICVGCHTAVLEATEEWRRPLTAKPARHESKVTDSTARARAADDEQPGTHAPGGRPPERAQE